MKSYTELRDIGRSYGDKDFCTVITVGLCLETTFEDAWNLLQSKGRKIGKGVSYNAVFEALRDRGMEVTSVYSRHRTRDYNGNVSGYSAPSISPDYPRFRFIKTVNDLASYLPRKGTFMVGINGHVLTYVNGKVEDFTANRSHRVLDIWEVTGTPIKNEAAVMPIGMRRHREEGRKGLNSAVRTRTDTFQWELRRADTQQVLKRYKRASRKIINGVQYGTIYLVSDRSVPLVLVNTKTRVAYRKLIA